MTYEPPNPAERAYEERLERERQQALEKEVKQQQHTEAQSKSLGRALELGNQPTSRNGK